MENKEIKKMNCRFCTHYKEDNCELCQFEYDEHYNPYAKDDWDIFKLKEEDGWEHIQILDRLHYKNIECLFADIWFDNNMAFLIGCKKNENDVARALNIHEEVVYNDFEHGMMIINLFQEKYIRGCLDENKR